MSSWSHLAATQDRGVADRRDLVDGEVSGQTVTTTVLYGSRRTQRCLKRGQRCTEAGSPTCMAAWWLSSPAGACLWPQGGTGSGVRAPRGREGPDTCKNRARGGAKGRGPRSGVLRRGALNSGEPFRCGGSLPKRTGAST
jgi:hypothetical protein